MKRPVLYAAGALFFSLLFPLFLGFLYSAIIAGIVVTIAITLIILRKKRKYFLEVGCVLLFTVVGILYMFLSISASVTPLKQLENKALKVSAVVIAKPQTDESSTSYTLKIDSVEGVTGLPKNFKATVYCSDKLPAEPFDRINATIKFYEMREPAGLSGARDKVFIIGSIVNNSANVQKNDGFEIRRIPIDISNYVSDLFSDNMDEREAEMLKAIVLGDVSGIDSEMRNGLAATGVLHVVSVSGFHLSFLAGNLLLLLRKLRISRKIYVPFTLAVVWLIAAVAGLSPPVIRSAVMYTVMLCGILFFKTPDTLNSLGVAAFIVLMINPFAAADVSFQLSFSATLGLLTLGAYLNERTQKFYPQNKILHKIMSGVFMGINTSISAALFTFPVMLLSFDDVSLISPLSNVLLITPASLALMISFIAAIISPASFIWFIWKPLLFVSSILIKIFIFGTELLAMLPFASLNISSDTTAICTALILIIIAAALVIGNEKGKIYRMAAMLSMLLILATGFLNIYNSDHISEVNVIGANRNIAVVITHAGRAFAVGSAVHGEYEVRETMSGKGIKSLDMMILPMLNDTFAAGAANTLELNKCNLLLAPNSGKLYNDIMEIDCEKSPLEGAVINYRDDFLIEIITESAIFITCFDKTIIIAPPGLDMNRIDPKYRHPSILISGTAAPLNFDASLSKVIITGSHNKALYAADALGTPAYICTKDETITAVINKNGDMKFIRR